MSKINKVKVDNVIYDIEDAEARKLINSLQTDFDDIKIPTKLSELENDDNYIKSTENAYFPNGVRMYNHNTQSDGRKVDLLIGHIQGVGYGGYEDDLHLNHRSSNDVRILEDGTGTLYYKGNEVADREYVDEKIADIEIGGGGISKIPIASATTLGGVKVGANLSIDENGVLSASGSGSNLDIYSTEEQVVGTYDGETVYRKIIRGKLDQTYANAYWCNTQIGNGDVKRIVDYNGTIFDTADDSGNGFNLNYATRATLLSTGYIRIDMHVSTFANKYFDGWVDYTKRS